MKIKELSKFKFKNSIPVLDNLKFENGKVTFGSLDSKITMETDVVGNGLVNFDEVKKILAKYPDAQCILNGKFEITKGNKKFTIQAESIEDYPTDVLPGEYIMDLTIDKEFNSLKDYLGKDDWRPSLTGVLVEKEYMVATNTHILKKIKVDGCNDPIILPPDIFKCELGTYKVFKHKDGVTLIGDITYQFMLIDERYPDWNTDRLESNVQFRQLTDWIWNHPRTELIFGSSTCKIYPGPESATVTSRVSNNIYYDVFNSAVFIDRNGTGQVYHKSILVSGVEKMPFRKYLGFMNDLVFDLGGTTGSLGRQEEPSNFILKNGVEVAPVICYESVFGEYLTRFVQKGAGLIVVITNDGWWRNTPGYKQHLSFSRLRAIETRRSLARSANTGISCFINQKGDIIKLTGWWEEDAIEGSLNLNDSLTFYTRYGDYIARISMFTAILLLLFMTVKRFIKE